MPVIGIPVKKLTELLRKDIGKERLLQTLERLGCDVEGYTTYKRFSCTVCDGITEVTETEDAPAVCATCGNDFRERPQTQTALGEVEVIRMELLAVRPDMFDPGGLARVLRGYFDMETGLAEYRLSPPVLEVTVDGELSRPDSYRPWIACAVMRNIHVDTEFIRIIMKLQENLHWAIGRNRKHASIGIYDLDTVQGNFRYLACDPETTRFNPLGGMPAGHDHEATAKNILDNHPKGVEFKYLLESFRLYPILVDSKDRVLSMPPIINSNETKVTHATTAFFIDVTGTSERIVNKTLNVLTTSLLEINPEVILEQVTIKYAGKTVITPDFTPETMKVSREKTVRILGIELSEAETVHHLQRMRHGVVRADDDGIEVLIAPYRNDILHERDLMEDIGISYGFHNIPWQLVKTMTVGRELPVETRSRVARNTLTGMGFIEVLNIVLSSQQRNFEDLRIKSQDNVVLISNPVSPQFTMLRTCLLPGILETFENNRDHELPQKIFEIGEVSILDQNSETGAKEIRKICGAIIGPKTGYADIRSVTERLIQEYNLKLDVRPVDDSTCIPGRAAEIICSTDKGEKYLGIMGEIHPEVLTTFSLIHPVAAFEIVLPDKE